MRRAQDRYERAVSTREPRPLQIVEDRWATVRHIVEVVAIVAAGVWAFYTFIYQERIKPGNDPAALAADITVHRLGRDARREILGVVTSYRNVGKTEISVAANGYNIWGIRYASAPSSYAYRGRAIYKVGSELRVVSRRLIRSFAELRSAAEGGRAGHYIVLQPGELQSIETVIAIPRGTYDSIDAQILAVPVKTSLGHPAHIRIEHGSQGESSLIASGDGILEDDTETNFALIP